MILKPDPTLTQKPLFQVTGSYTVIKTAGLEGEANQQIGFFVACRSFNKGCLYSLDWTTGLDYWTGLLDSPFTPKQWLEWP